MTNGELKDAMAIATSDADLSAETGQIDIFSGFGLPDFKQVAVTTRQVASLIRWQALAFDGSIDAEALNEIAHAGRRKFQIVD